MIFTKTTDLYYLFYDKKYYPNNIEILLIQKNDSLKQDIY